jgi:hydroxymethylpyrimidine/phosphomethylpyrimidine kinase
LLPRIDLLTPNIPEAIKLGIIQHKTRNYPIVLADSLCNNILITGTHSDSKQVHNSLYSDGTLVEKTTWNRLKHEYHGSGCTLASNISAWLAHGFSLQAAVNKGQAYTWNSLDQAQCLGQGQYIPYRI